MNSNTRILSNKTSSGTLAQYNYVQNVNSIIQDAIGTWSLFNTTLTNGIPTGSITAGAASLTLSQTATNALGVGNGNLQVASAGAITAGQGFITPAFSIYREDIAKVLNVRFSYEVVSGLSNMNFSGTSSNTWAVYLYDVANSQWVQPAGVYSMTQGIGPATSPSITFQTAANATSYQLAFICVNASAGAMSVNFQQFYCGPQYSPSGAAVTDWNNNLTFTTAGLGTPTINLYTQRVGDTLKVRGTIIAGTVTTGELIQLPAGYTINTSKLPSTATGTQVGVYALAASGASNTFSTAGSGGVLFYDGSTNNQIFINTQSASNVFAKNNPVSTGSLLTVDFEIPITGWSSNVSMSNDTDTREVAAFINNASTQAVTANATLLSGTATKDTHGAWSTNQYTVPVAGDYMVFANQGSGSAAVGIDAYVNGVFTVNRVVYSPSGNSNGGANFLVNLKAGDIISFRCSVSTTLTANGNLSIIRVSGPAVIAANETVAARYTNSSAVSVSTTPTTMQYNTKDFDTHNAVTTGASWKFTAPISGTYAISGFYAMSGSLGVYGYVYKNGSKYCVVGTKPPSGVDEQPLNMTTIRLNAGDYINIALQTFSSSANTSGNTDVNWVCIERIGN